MKTTFLIKLLSETNKPEIMNLLLKALFTNKEIKELENRIKIFQLLLKGKKQREISEILNVGIATVTRGASVLENEDIFKVNSKVIQILKTNKIDLND
jgi:TrpR family trp operon transcriptional repressor|tara:strand:- start:59 stop:352 length:294 start_codon:yes stop_codon:yes gene_type:complete